MKLKSLVIAIIASMLFAFAPQNLFAGVDLKQSGTEIGKTDRINFANGCFALAQNGTSIDVTPGSSCVVEGATADAFEDTISYQDPTADNAITVLEGADSFMNYFITTTGASVVPCNTARKGSIAVFTNASSATDCTVGGGSTVNPCFCSGTTWTNLN